jgi:hypothetical protein
MIIDVIQSILNGDSQLTTILTGGIYSYLDKKEISRQFTPNAYDEFEELKPTLLIREETTTADNMLYDSADMYIVLFFYELFGYRNTSAARKRVYELLHRSQPISDDSTGIYQVFHANDVSGQEDTAINASLEQSRYQIKIQRGRT